MQERDGPPGREMIQGFDFASFHWWCPPRAVPAINNVIFNLTSKRAQITGHVVCNQFSCYYQKVITSLQEQLQSPAWETEKEIGEGKIAFWNDTSTSCSLITVRREKLLYILHELLHFIHDGRFLNQLWVEVYEVVIYVPKTKDQNGYISIFLLVFLHHNQWPNLLAN